LLNPDERQRIKSKDIFSHPWVKSFDRRQEEIKVIDCQEFKLDLFKVSDEKKVIYKNNIDNNKNSHTSTNYSAKNSSNRKDSKELEREILNKTINQQKESLIQEALNSTNNEFSILNNQDDNNLFDKVLSQVIKKNGIFQ
jgi:hypothetical protein